VSPSRVMDQARNWWNRHDDEFVASHGKRLRIEVRAGLNTGECGVRGDDIGGMAVHIGARVSALAGPNDVLVSSTLRDSVIGSELEFDERGAYELKGVPEEWHLSAVVSS
jgi:class 3 adenylate cyclase